MKKLLYFIGIILFMTGCSFNKEKLPNEPNESKEPETIINTNENVIKDQNFEGLTITNTSLVTENGISTLVTQVTNNTSADYELIEFIITVKDANGNVIAKFPGYVGEIIRIGETRIINSSIDIDLSNAASIEYSVSK